MAASERPAAPALPDVFSAPSASSSFADTPPSSPAPKPRSLVPVDASWVLAGSSHLSDACSLEAGGEVNAGLEDANPGDRIDSLDPATATSLTPPPSIPASPPPSPRDDELADSLADLSLFQRHRNETTPRRQRSSLAHPPFSPFAPTFNPTVGGSGIGHTPTRKDDTRTSGDQSSRSSPATPYRPWKSTAPPASTPPPACSTNAPVDPVSWTWPPRVNKTGELALRYRSPVKPTPPYAFQEVTPTKSSANSTSLIATPTTPTFASQQYQRQEHSLATRYVLVEGFRSDLSERDLRDLLERRCAKFSLRGCFTARLRDFGEIVLLFNDVRDALLARHAFGPSPLDPRKIRATCITRDSFEQLASRLQADALLSPSEAVLVLTLRGPASSPAYFSPLSLLASFGDIRSLKLVEEYLYVVEYWDDRAAERAYQSLKGREEVGIRFDCSFEPTVASIELPTTSGTHDEYPAGRFSSREHNPLSPSPVPYFDNRSAPNTSSLPAEIIQPLAPTLGQSVATAAPALSYPPTPLLNPAFDPFAPSRPSSSADSPREPFSPVAPAGLLHFAPRPSAAPFQPQPVAVDPRAQSHQGGGAGSARQNYGIVRDDRIPSGNVLNFERIERGLDLRTTVMIKNIPNKLKDYEVMHFIDQVVGSAYDFFYLRCDYSNDCNVGYGFVNFTSTTSLLAFAKARLGTRWNKCGSDKLCVMSYANIQGKASLISHFRNSSVLDQDESRRPKLFVTSGPRAGEPEAFPACDDPIRKARSAANASNVGLFPSHKPVFKVAQAFKGPLEG
ncbi:hypothetical protein Rhopal_005544-T1 [Rhodotorula paludigena]|uniref:Mei2-like C-terminal RNA recognition motif domain-containing protein n=1 Tax=Rhodotorula paludigena TaxID=86838 RepID=A0AAV5GPT6_9BASI|nr:hypothetical protein Rhopal_005544-T1 [Rhodotorula paludigena]